MSERKVSEKKRFVFQILLFLIPAVVISLAYFAYTTYKTKSLYFYVKSNQRGWSGKVHGPDKDLGFAPVPNSIGSEIIPFGADIPIRYDKDGFRIPIEDENDSENIHPVVLALGCSFTYGDAIRAEDTFPYLVGNYLGGSTKNAGVCSYSLSQMVILAKRLIPRHKPDYVIVQYSPWLVSRAVLPFAPSYFGKLPNPYFTEKENNLVIHPPVFQQKITELPIDEYRTSPKDYGDFLSFLWNVGLPLCLYDDVHMSAYTLAKAFGLVAQPTANSEAVIKHAYGEIQRVAEENGAKVIIAVIGSNHDRVLLRKDLLPNDAVVVDAHGALLKRLPVVDIQSYQKHYAHWQGNPPRLVDGHPNEEAHRIIALEIVSQIAPASGAQPDKPMPPTR